MTNKRLVIIGIDGMDYEMVEAFRDNLPNLSSLARYGVFSPFKSVFPPDSIPSWVTAYTGLDPSEHGILESVNYLAKGNERLQVDASIFKGMTFWDIVGNEGNSVCVINPFLAYPVWPVNGVMVNGPVFVDGKIQVSDPKMTSNIHIPTSLGGITDFPKKKHLFEFLNKTIKETKEQADFGLSLMKKQKPDLFFQTFLTLDRIQHFLWRYCDSNDPTYPGKNEYDQSIKQFYILYDEIIGRFINSIEEDAVLLVISDHGHGMRCSHCFNINEYFRRQGYVTSKVGNSEFNTKILQEKIKNRILRFMNDHDLEDYISTIAKIVPNAKEMKKGKILTSASLNKAYASDFNGTNPFGGISINRDLVEDYDGFRTTLINELNGLTHMEKSVFKWICPREDVYSGPFLRRFPDILFEMEPHLGVNWALYTDIFTINPTHKKISGGHRTNGVIFMNKNNVGGQDLDRFQMINLFPSVLGHFKITPSFKLTGQSWL